MMIRKPCRPGGANKAPFTPPQATFPLAGPPRRGCRKDERGRGQGCCSESGAIANETRLRSNNYQRWRLRNLPALTLGREHKSFTMAPISYDLHLRRPFDKSVRLETEAVILAFEPIALILCASKVMRTDRKGEVGNRRAERNRTHRRRSNERSGLGQIRPRNPCLASTTSDDGNCRCNEGSHPFASTPDPKGLTSLPSSEKSPFSDFGCAPVFQGCPLAVSVVSVQGLSLERGPVAVEARYNILYKLTYYYHIIL